jgi:hypothetical protein
VNGIKNSVSDIFMVSMAMLTLFAYGRFSRRS